MKCYLEGPVNKVIHLYLYIYIVNYKNGIGNCEYMTFYIRVCFFELHEYNVYLI